MCIASASRNSFSINNYTDLKRYIYKGAVMTKNWKQPKYPATEIV